MNFRVSPADFTRTRALTFPIVALSILRGRKVSQQNALNKVFRELDQLEAVPTASAYCQARQKLKPELFTRLNQMVVEDFYRLYQANGAVKRWRGRRLLGADGTRLNLPDTPKKMFSTDCASCFKRIRRAIAPDGNMIAQSSNIHANCAITAIGSAFWLNLIPLS